MSIRTSPPLPVLLRRALAALALPLLLAACATPGVPSSDTAPALESSYHDAILLGGRLSLRYQQNGAEQSMHGNFTWEQKPQQALLTLRSPFGQTLATIAITPRYSTLTQADQAPRSAPDVDSLVAQALGWPLPISGLRDWLQGFATDAHGQPFRAGPQPGANHTITRDGWALRYVSWQDESGALHPRRIDLVRDTHEAGEVELRIVIDAWQPL